MIQIKKVKRRFKAEIMQIYQLTKKMTSVGIKHHHMVSSSYTEWPLINSGKAEAQKAMKVAEQAVSNVKDVSSSVSTRKKRVDEIGQEVKGVKTTSKKAWTAVEALKKK